MYYIFIYNLYLKKDSFILKAGSITLVQFHVSLAV